MHFNGYAFMICQWIVLKVISFLIDLNVIGLHKNVAIVSVVKWLQILQSNFIDSILIIYVLPVKWFQVLLCNTNDLVFPHGKTVLGIPM